MEKLASGLRSQALPDWPQKEIFLCPADSLDELVPKIAPVSSHFGLLLATDADRATDKEVFAAAARLISRGLVYLCAWGPGCEKIEELFDQEAVELDVPDCVNGVIMTTSHSDEQLSEALWFFLNCAFATQSYASTCTDWIMAPIGNTEWESIVRAEIEKITRG